MENKGTFNSYYDIVQKYPVGKDGWQASVQNKIYIWDKKQNKWTNNISKSTSWGDIGGDILNQSDLIDYINNLPGKYPKDYIEDGTTLTIQQYENYAIWNPMVNDGTIINDGTLIIN